MTDNARLHGQYDITTAFKRRASKGNPCGCVTRGDGAELTYCHAHNTRQGTHGGRRDRKDG